MENFIIGEDPRDKITQLRSSLSLRVDEVKSRITNILELGEMQNIGVEQRGAYLDFAYIGNPHRDGGIESLLQSINHSRRIHPDINITDENITNVQELYKATRVVFLLDRISGRNTRPSFHEYENDSYREQNEKNAKELILLGAGTIRTEDISDAEKVKAIGVVEAIIGALKGHEGNISMLNSDALKELLKKISRKFEGLFCFTDAMFAEFEKERRGKWGAFVQPTLGTR